MLNTLIHDATTTVHRHTRWANEIIKAAREQAKYLGLVLDEELVELYREERCAGNGHTYALGKACKNRCDKQTRIFRACMTAGFLVLNPKKK